MRDYLWYTTTFQLPEFCTQNFLSASTQVFQEGGVQSTPPLPKHENLLRIWHLGFELVCSTPLWKWKLGQDLELSIWVGLEYPHPTNENSVRTWNGIWVGLEYPPPPKWKLGQDLGICIWVGLEYPTSHDNLVRTWHLGFELVWITPHSPKWKLGQDLELWIWVSLGTLPHPKWKFGQDLTLLIWVGLEYPPPPPPPENENLARTWDFGFELICSTHPLPNDNLVRTLALGIWVGLDYPHPPPPPNENLARTWNFGFELVWGTLPHPKMKIWSGLDTFDLSWSGVSLPPPLRTYCGSWWVETNRCIPLGYHLVLMVIFRHAK